MQVLSEKHEGGVGEEMWYNVMMSLLLGRYGEQGQTIPMPWLARLGPEVPSCTQCTLPGGSSANLSQGQGQHCPSPAHPCMGCLFHPQSVSI
jgi:hypothetical protein